MREILFRGKQNYNGEWITGYLVDSHNIGNWLLCEPVIPETVGQYTGLTDKNGKKIFEGDIVQYFGTYALEVYVEKGHTKIRWFDAVTSSKCTELFFGYDEEAYGEYEVIGNVHDNPELLKEG